MKNLDLNKQNIERLLDPYIKNLDIFIYDSLTSTNDVAKEMTSLNKNDFVIISNHQSYGKGRLGKTFYSPKDTGIYISFALNLNKNFENTLKITTLSSVLVCDTIKQTLDLNVKIKWVNDIFLENKKVCGILTESINNCNENTLKTIILGIGINLYPFENKNENLENIAGFLSANKNIDKNLLITNLINNILLNLYNIEKINFINKYKSLSNVINKNIVFYIKGEKQFGYVIDIDENGYLIVKNKNSEILTLSSGEITIRTI
ncbi:MAG: biotin--[acetyl-CoA-carboxylase] ligase [Oscillospiraceae bacterium]